jgi:hypothetical protein
MASKSGKALNDASPSSVSTKFFPVLYNPPTTPDIAIVMAFFNPARSLRILQNILMVKSLFERSNIPFFIGEIAFNEEPFVFPVAENIFQYRSESYMFYKENLINLMVPKLPTQYTKVLMMDADIVFQEPNWYDVVSKKLDTCAVIQPFQTANYLNQQFQVIQIKHSVAAMASGGHTGFAWAFQRAWLSENPLFDYSVIGGGDSILKARVFQTPLMSVHKTYEKDYNAYNPKRTETLGWCPLTVFHLPHGMKENRQYDTRNADLGSKFAALKITSVSDAVKRRDDGLLVWKDAHRAELNKLMKVYFMKRNDDA